MNPTPPLLRLVYCSRNTIAQARPGAALYGEVQAILATSRRNNQRAGVTGALLFTEHAFVQALEGPARAVEETFERIQLDPRHADVTVLEAAPVQERRFGTWSMGYCGQATEGQLAAFGLDGDLSKPHPSGADPVVRLLYSLLESEAEWAGMAAG